MGTSLPILEYSVEIYMEKLIMACTEPQQITQLTQEEVTDIMERVKRKEMSIEEAIALTRAIGNKSDPKEQKPLNLVRKIL
ncbi:hypothetical protein GDO86_014518 [Hymenochirus boettgeri]|uniref:Uncharacterized protein n=1 Tax=Hymenochirus boettgeri TaxID=247094 RepID=A0A8T2JS17_9PIPI|nr:hypothetical protein GDO86_014518 [Hymenochirus boettgeri]